MDYTSNGHEAATVNPSTVVKEHGLTLLSHGLSPEADVFFVHGLQGHPRETWTYSTPLAKNDPLCRHDRSHGFRKRFRTAFASPKLADSSASVTKQNVYWPMDLLPKDFPNIRIFTFGYDSHVTHWFKGSTMQLDIYSYGESLLNGLEARRREAPERPLVFIVHSLGGLVLKDTLRRSRSSNEQRFKNIYLSTKAILFFGTPHRGGSYVNMGLTVQKILVCSGFDANDKILRDLRFDSSTAKLLSEEFAKILDETRPKVYTFQEASGISGFGPLSGKVVEDTSSALDYSLQSKDIIYANHMDMCRFSGSEDDGYEKTKAALSHCLSIDVAPTASGMESGHEIHQRILASLYLPDSQERLDQVEDACEGTFGWLYEKQNLGFVEWLRTGKGIFWISGKPASGKSTLLKYAVSNPQTYDYLRQNNPGNRWVCGDFFFTNRGKQTQKSIEGLLQRILYQLLSQVPALVAFVEQIFKQHAEIQGEWLLIYLEDALMKIVRQRKLRLNIYLSIDALDEHDENYHENHFRLLQILENMIQGSDGKAVKVMLCLTSRPENVFQDTLRGYPGFRIHEHTHQDIITYLNTRMTKYLRSRPDLRCDAQVMASLDEIFGEVTRRAQGVFLWVKLVITDIIEGLIDGESPHRLHQNLSAIPGDGDLQELYSGILLRLKATYLSEAFLMLQVAYSTTEPMSFTEFFQVLDFTIKGHSNYDWDVRPEAEMERRLASRCRGFLEIQQSYDVDDQGIKYDTPIVQFLHQSVKDFLHDSRTFENMRGYLRPMFPNAASWLLENGHAFILRFRVSQHLRRYAAEPSQIKQLARFDLRKFDVLYHAYMVELTLEKAIPKPLNTLADFADKNGLVPFYLRHEEWNVPQSWQPTFLVLAVQAGLLMYVQYCHERRVDISRLSGRPLLHYAVLPMPMSLCRRGTDPFLTSPKMIKLLVRLGCSVHSTFEGFTPFCFLFNAVSQDQTTREHLRMLETLLHLGSSTEDLVRWDYQIRNPELAPARSSDMPMTALQLAVQLDNLQLAKLLLRYNASTAALSEADWKYLRKGYRYGDKSPEFQDTDDATKEEQLEKWLADRERTIREGKNKKPMLEMIEEHIAGRGRTIKDRSPSSSRRVQAEDLYYDYRTGMLQTGFEP